MMSLLSCSTHSMIPSGVLTFRLQTQTSLLECSGHLSDARALSTRLEMLSEDITPSCRERLLEVVTGVIAYITFLNAVCKSPQQYEINVDTYFSSLPASPMEKCTLTSGTNPIS